MSEITTTENALKSLKNASNNSVEYAYEASLVYKESMNSAMNALRKSYNIPSFFESAIVIEKDETQKLLNSFFQHNKTAGYSKSLDSILYTINNIISNFIENKKTYEDISFRIIDKISSIEEINTIIEQMKQIAKEIKIFSINSVIVASQAGSEGMGFKSISRFIIELSDSIQKAAVQLDNYRDKILKSHESLKKQFDYLLYNLYQEKISKIDIIAKEHIAHARDKFAISTDLIVSMNDFLDAIMKKGLEIGQSYNASRRILKGIVFWDNGLELLSEVSPIDIDEDKKSQLEKISFIYHAYKLLANKMASTTQEITVAADNVLNIFFDLISEFGSAQQDQIYILNFLGAPGKEDSLLTFTLQDVHSSIELVKDILTEEKQVKEQLINTFNEMEKIHHEGLSFFYNFEKFFVTMNNINILAQIEMGKTSFGSSGNTNLKTQFSLTLEKLKDFNENIKNNIQKMLTNLITEMNRFSDFQLEHSNVLRNSSSALDIHLANLHYSYSSVVKIISTIKDENSKIFSTEINARKSLTDAKETVNNYLNTFTNIKKEVSKNLEKLDGLIKFYNIDVAKYSTNQNSLIANFDKVQKNLM